MMSPWRSASPIHRLNSTFPTPNNERMPPIKADCAVSNVRGPEDALHILGREVKQIVGFLPPPPGCPLGVAVTSYRGQLQVSVNANKQTFAALRLNGAGGGEKIHEWRACDAEEFLFRMSRRLEAIAAAGGGRGTKVEEGDLPSCSMTK